MGLQVYAEECWNASDSDRVGSVHICAQVYTPFAHVRTYSPKFALRYSFLGFEAADGKIKPFYKDDLSKIQSAGVPGNPDLLDGVDKSIKVNMSARETGKIAP